MLRMIYSNRNRSVQPPPAMADLLLHISGNAVRFHTDRAVDSKSAFATHYAFSFRSGDLRKANTCHYGNTCHFAESCSTSGLLTPGCSAEGMWAVPCSECLFFAVKTSRILSFSYFECYAVSLVPMATLFLYSETPGLPRPLCL